MSREVRVTRARSATWSRWASMRWTRCRGSSLAWAASEADRAGDVNHVWTGSGFSGMWTWWRQHERDCRHTWPCRVVWSVVAFDMHTCKPHGPKRVRRFGPMSDLQLSLDRRLAWLALAPMHPSSEAYGVSSCHFNSIGSATAVFDRTQLRGNGKGLRPLSRIRSSAAPYLRSSMKLATHPQVPA